jgi:hypothetical protein
MGKILFFLSNLKDFIREFTNPFFLLSINGFFEKTVEAFEVLSSSSSPVFSCP